MLNFVCVLSFVSVTVCLESLVCHKSLSLEPPLSSSLLPYLLEVSITILTITSLLLCGAPVQLHGRRRFM